LRQAHVINALRVLTTGEEAVAYLCGEQGKADALVQHSSCSCSMCPPPGLNGYQVLQWVRTDEQTKDIPVIMKLTGT